MTAAPRRDPQAASAAAQDYLKAVWTLQEWAEEPVTTTLLASRLGLSPSTVSEQVRRLVDRGLLLHDPYQPVQLTGRGRREALGVVRRHRLLETYLVAELGYTWDEVHAEAELLEHVVSDVLVERMDAKLGHPRLDPHGDPIPTSEGEVERPRTRPLADCGPGERGVVVRVSDRDPAVLRWCDERGVRPGAVVEVTSSADHPGSGPQQPADAVLVEVTGAAAVAVPRGAATAIHVART